MSAQTSPHGDLALAGSGRVFLERTAAVRGRRIPLGAGAGASPLTSRPLGDLSDKSSLAPCWPWSPTGRRPPSPVSPPQARRAPRSSPTPPSPVSRTTSSSSPTATSSRSRATRTTSARPHRRGHPRRQGHRSAKGSVAERRRRLRDQPPRRRLLGRRHQPERHPGHPPGDRSTFPDGTTPVTHHANATSPTTCAQRQHPDREGLRRPGRQQGPDGAADHQP